MLRTKPGFSKEVYYGTRSFKLMILRVLAGLLA